MNDVDSAQKKSVEVLFKNHRKRGAYERQGGDGDTWRRHGSASVVYSIRLHRPHLHGSWSGQFQDRKWQMKLHWLEMPHFGWKVQ